MKIPVRVVVASSSALLLLVGLLWVFGSTIPRDHEASASVDVAAPPDDVFLRISDRENYTKWRSDLQRVVIESAERHIEEGSFGPMPMKRIREEPGRVRVTETDDPDLGFGGTWTFEVEPTPGGSRIRITERGFVESPIFRIIQKHVVGYDTTLKGYLADLQKSFAAGSAPRQ